MLVKIFSNAAQKQNQSCYYWSTELIADEWNLKENWKKSIKLSTFHQFTRNSITCQPLSCDSRILTQYSHKINHFPAESNLIFLIAYFSISKFYGQIWTQNHFQKRVNKLLDDFPQSLFYYIGLNFHFPANIKKRADTEIVLT